MKKLAKTIPAMLFLLLLALPIARAAPSYSVSINYANGTFELGGVLLVQTTAPAASETGEYSAKVLSFKNKALFETKFNLNLEKIYGLPISIETAQLPPEKAEKTAIGLSLPHYSNAKTLQITKGQEVLLQASLEKFATCNENGACGNLETFENCPADCACGNKKCEEGESPLSCPIDCPPTPVPITATQKQEPRPETSDYAAYAIVGIIALIIVAVAARTFAQKTGAGKKR